MGRADNTNRSEWAAKALNAFAEGGFTPTAVVTAFLHILSETAPSEKAFVNLIVQVGNSAREVDDALVAAGQAEEEEPLPTLPEEVRQAMAMLGIDPNEVTVMTPRSTGKQAAGACNCNRCVVEEAKAGFLVNEEGEA
jgi:hypothetical protein